MTSSNQEYWVVRYRPQKLSDLFGLDAQKQLLKEQILAFAKGNALQKAFLLHGPPGCGKTTLVECIANDLEVDSHVTNASDSRTASDLKSIFSASRTAGVGSKIRLIVLDEAEGIARFTQRNLVKYIQNTAQPVILICNDISKMNWDVRKYCLEIAFHQPSQDSVADYLSHVFGKVGAHDIQKAHAAVRHISAIAPSFRWAVGAFQNHMEWDMPLDLLEPPSPTFTKSEEVQRILSGRFQEFSGDPQELMMWMFDATGNFSVIEEVSRILSRINENDYHQWRYASGILMKLRGDPKSVEPRTFRMMSKIKIKHEKIRSRDKIKLERAQKVTIEKGAATLTLRKATDERAAFDNFF